MVVVDERVSASERSSKTAQGERSQTADGGLSGVGLGLDALGLDFNTGMDRRSRDVGETNREGDLTALLGVRVVSMDANGNLQIEGQRSVEVDGRTQAITLSGVIRSEDVSASNHILSSRIADAVISYQGKSISPSSGILGKIISLLWP
jgi:flagellar L-ring protein precursor FlgH